MYKLTSFAAVIIGVILFIVVVPLLSRTDQELVSPVLKESKTLGLNQWFPQNVLGVSIGAPEITARAAFFIDTSTGEVFYSNNEHQRLPVASLVKVMTALIALEHRSLDEKFPVSKRAAEAEPDKMLLIPGEKLTLKELLYGIFLISANDGAEVLAEDSTEGREDFINLMNDKAVQLGMRDTFYANPTGLDEDSKNSYSSAYDLAILTRYAIKHFPVLVDISKTEHIVLPKTLEHQDYDMYSGINLLTTYPGVVQVSGGSGEDSIAREEIAAWYLEKLANRIDMDVEELTGDTKFEDIWDSEDGKWLRAQVRQKWGRNVSDEEAKTLVTIGLAIDATYKLVNS